MQVSYLDLKQLNISKEEVLKKAFENVLKSGWFILGEAVDKFEKEFSLFTQTKYCIGVANGLDALILSLKVLNIGEGDEVIVPSNTYIATWLAVSYVGATPIPVEPNIYTYNINTALIEEKISHKTKAIIPVNLYGQAAELEDIRNIAIKYNLYVIEDNAQSQGASYKDKPTGSWGDINATSFYPGKNLGALGDGGAVTTDNEELSQKIRVVRNYGSQKKYYNEIKGVNSRLDELQAAFLSEKLKYLSAENEERVRLAKVYDEELKNVGDLILPQISCNATSVYHIYLVRTKQRDELQNHLTNRNIGTVIHYPIPPHLQEAYQELGYKRGDFPLAEEIAETCLSIPLYPGLSAEQQGFVIEAIRQFFN
ncbi:MAG: DegT/DnrJ/EryC1/StrS family aminotransferase [Chitinophagales bacterium]|nr:DegT/DnrJ/EryC1/StrS family aminotransferase [Chitinophagales bacterium]MCO5247781.1 DegT/DnrJ/EryC1/StrS family aminotransferase [Chitinophagales bacterium]